MIFSTISHYICMVVLAAVAPIALRVMGHVVPSFLLHLKEVGLAIPTRR